MKAVIARIIARYASGALVSYGLLSPDAADLIFMDPDVLIAIGAGLGILTEAVYAVGRKRGWVT